jgi:uncharacterized protein (DUF2237 family)
MNVLGGPLELCCTDPLTGFYRDGACNTGSGDAGVHVVCAEMTVRFLAFSKATGNDLSTSVPEFGFEGLKPGDRWCLCVLRWNEAYDAGEAPLVLLASTHAMALEFVTLEALQEYAADME